MATDGWRRRWQPLPLLERSEGVELALLERLPTDNSGRTDMTLPVGYLNAHVADGTSVE